MRVRTVSPLANGGQSFELTARQAHGDWRAWLDGAEVTDQCFEAKIDSIGVEDVGGNSFEGRGRVGLYWFREKKRGEKYWQTGLVRLQKGDA